MSEVALRTFFLGPVFFSNNSLAMVLCSVHCPEEVHCTINSARENSNFSSRFGGRLGVVNPIPPKILFLTIKYYSAVEMSRIFINVLLDKAFRNICSKSRLICTDNVMHGCPLTVSRPLFTMIYHHFQCTWSFINFQ